MFPPVTTKNQEIRKTEYRSQESELSNTNPKHKARAELPAGINPQWFGQLTILNQVEGQTQTNF